MNDGVSRQAPPLPDMSRHTLSVEEAAALFVDAGTPKSIRTVQRYCRSDILECIRTDTELGDKYLIDRASVDRRIEELKRFQQMMATTPVATSPDTSRPDASRRDNPNDDAAPRVKELEAEVLNLKIDNRAKEIVITQLVDERKGFMSQLTDQATRIGELRTKLLQLVSPKAAAETEPALEPIVYEVQRSPSPSGDNPPGQFPG